MALEEKLDWGKGRQMATSIGKRKMKEEKKRKSLETHHLTTTLISATGISVDAILGEKRSLPINEIRNRIIDAWMQRQKGNLGALQPKLLIL